MLTTRPNLILQYMKERGIKRKIGIQILDNEANYEYSVQFMHRILQANSEYLEIYWCCMPITLPCTVSAYEVNWQCWGVADKPRWVRPMPTESYIVNINNHPFGDKFIENMNYDDDLKPISNVSMYVAPDTMREFSMFTDCLDGYAITADNAGDDNVSIFAKAEPGDGWTDIVAGPLDISAFTPARKKFYFKIEADADAVPNLEIVKIIVARA